MERRKGGETGVSSVQTLIGGDIWAAATKGLWSLDLGQAALGLVDVTSQNEAAADVAAEISGPRAASAFAAAVGNDPALML
eukprot:SAG31_NODE_23740_length_497_cov_0.937186_2_plen_80_part_01